MGNLLAKVVEGTKFLASAGVGSSCAIMDLVTIIMELKDFNTERSGRLIWDFVYVLEIRQKSVGCSTFSKSCFAIYRSVPT